jgi:hypothetical protein
MSANNQIPESLEMGKLFENYLRCHIFVKKHFVILDKTYDFQVKPDDSIESSLNPDFRMRDKTNRVFYLQAKFTTDSLDDKINWCNSDQLKLYQEFDKTHPVFIAIGLDGKPDYPKNLFVIPLQEVAHSDLSLSVALKYQFPLGKPIIPDDLWNLVKVDYRKAG